MSSKGITQVHIIPTFIVSDDEISFSSDRQSQLDSKLDLKDLKTCA